jgi:hypothetical protein
MLDSMTLMFASLIVASLEEIERLTIQVTAESRSIPMYTSSHAVLKIVTFMSHCNGTPNGEDAKLGHELH